MIDQTPSNHPSPQDSHLQAVTARPAWSVHNHLYLVATLENTYYMMRHGESEANVANLIIGDPAVGTVSYGLTEEGKRQASSSALSLRALLGEAASEVVVISSDFKRARETAEAAAQVLGAKGGVAIDQALRERFFGQIEGADHLEYKAVFQSDLSDPFVSIKGVESLVSVMDRTTKLIENLERSHRGATLLLVAHGDPLLLLQAAFDKSDPRGFKSLGRFANAEIRKAQLAPVHP